MTPKDIKKLPYRRGVGIMLLNQHGLVFVAQRLDSQSDAWQMPQGGIDKGETPLQAAQRELKEETGVDQATFLAKSKGWYDYDLPPHLVSKVWRGRYRGQRQKWFAFRHLGPDSDIDIATEHPEFSEWRWIEMRALPEVIIAFKRPLYEALILEFGHLAGG